jgi:hypothetical protein
LTDVQNATVLGPPHGVAVKALVPCCHRSASRHAQAAAQKHGIC